MTSSYRSKQEYVKNAGTSIIKIIINLIERLLMVKVINR